MIRNLAFFVYPRSNGQRWKNAVNYLLANWGMFNGRKIVTISTDTSCNSPEEVQQVFSGRGCEFRLAANSRLQEMPHFLPMLEMLESDNHDEITLYAHAKGATHASPYAASHLWCNAMAEACLYHPKLIECTFRQPHINIAGRISLIRIVGLSRLSQLALRWDVVLVPPLSRLSLDWRNIHPNFMGVEAWPGLFTLDESASLFYDYANTGHLYSTDFWARCFTPALEFWRGVLASHEASKRPWESGALLHAPGL